MTLCPNIVIRFHEVGKGRGNNDRLAFANFIHLLSCILIFYRQMYICMNVYIQRYDQNLCILAFYYLKY